MSNTSVLFFVVFCIAFLILAQGYRPVSWRLFVGPFSIRTESPRIIYVVDSRAQIDVESTFNT